MPSITRTLRMVFENTEGRNTAISVWDPNPEVSAQVLEDTMDHIVNGDIFLSSGGDLVAKVKAELVERSVEDKYTA